MQCPRCRRTQPPEYAGRGSCVHCGQFLAGGIDWVAWPPGGYQVRGPRRTPRYTGPPSYPVPPRWGFPLVTWRRSTSIEPVPATARQRARSLAGTAQPLLWLAAGTSLLGAAAEVWRYLLLLDSRADALPAGRLRLSDALVTTGGVVSLAACALAGLVTLLWVLRAVPASAELAAARPARSTRELLLGWLVPGLNLFVPGSTLAEIEHAVLRRPAGERPRPSALLRAWWTAWVAGCLLVVLTLLWSLRGSTQAQADGVLLHALTDLVAATTAVLTVLVVRTLTGLMQPARPGRSRRMVVVKVYDDEDGSAGDRQRGQAADHELRPPRRLAGQPQPG
ncbi:MAG TPA: DUF4328 domain-containing protein [Pseudonocardiaceae bacterium]